MFAIQVTGSGSIPSLGKNEDGDDRHNNASGCNSNDLKRIAVVTALLRWYRLRIGNDWIIIVISRDNQLIRRSIGRVSGDSTNSRGPTIEFVQPC